MNEKKVMVEHMFDDIAPRYDILNHTLSFGIDIFWRKKLVDKLVKHKPKTILDVATGTGQLAIAAAERTDAKITAIDISEKMILKAICKAKNKNLIDKLSFIKADAEDLPFANSSFDATIVAFGTRNYVNLNVGLYEMFRVLKPGGKCLILEFGTPHNKLLKSVYHSYLNKLLPQIGRYISKNNDAYKYLPASVNGFPYGNDFKKILASVGFKNTSYISLSGGIAILYTALKEQ